jgi:hypothetical protein
MHEPRLSDKSPTKWCSLTETKPQAHRKSHRADELLQHALAQSHPSAAVGRGRWAQSDCRPPHFPLEPLLITAKRPTSRSDPAHVTLLGLVGVEICKATDSNVKDSAELAAACSAYAAKATRSCSFFRPPVGQRTIGQSLPTSRGTRLDREEGQLRGTCVIATRWMDVLTVLRRGAHVLLPFVRSHRALLTKEPSPLEHGVVDPKYYLRGIGDVREVIIKGGHERLAWPGQYSWK